jgi:hypothetical protein
MCSWQVCTHQKEPKGNTTAGGDENLQYHHPLDFFSCPSVEALRVLAFVGLIFNLTDFFEIFHLPIQIFAALH